MRRREFIKVIAGLAAAWPFAVHAQRTRGRLPLARHLRYGIRKSVQVHEQSDSGCIGHEFVQQGEL